MTRLRGRFVWSANLPLLLCVLLFPIIGLLTRGGLSIFIALSVIGAVVWAIIIGIMSIVYARHTITFDEAHRRLIIHPAKQFNPALDENLRSSRSDSLEAIRELTVPDPTENASPRAPVLDRDANAGIRVGTKTGVIDPAELDYVVGVVHRNSHGYGFKYDELWTRDGAQLLSVLSYNGWPATSRARVRGWVEQAGGTVSGG